MPNFKKDKSKFKMKKSAFKQYEGDMMSSPLKGVPKPVYQFQMPKFLEKIGAAFSGKSGGKKLKPTTIAQRLKQKLDLKG